MQYTAKRAIVFLALVIGLFIIVPAMAQDEATTNGTLPQLSWAVVSIQTDAVTTVKDQLTIEVVWSGRTETVTALSVSGGTDAEAVYSIRQSDWRALIAKLLEPTGEIVTLTGDMVVTLTEGMILNFVNCNGDNVSYRTHYVPFAPTASDKLNYSGASNVWVLQDTAGALWYALAPGENSPVVFNTSEGGRVTTVSLLKC